ncbi:MAG: DoxX family protein [Gammaproteobacteria bacterium]|nr:DoxX family protein [Gammaproteobacteria bacterium]
MKIAFSILLLLLTALAVLSGIAKIALIPNDVEFFGRYGFSDFMLITFGAVQLTGGILLPWKRTRLVGSTVVALTFLVSLTILIVDGNIPVSIVTAVATLLLFVVMKVSWPSSP